MTFVERVLKKSGYSNKAIELYLNKVNVETCDDADICLGYTGPCGDTMEFFLKIDAKRITDAKFQALGCEGAFISGSAVTEMIKNQTLEHAENLEEKQVIEYLNGIPEEKHDCVCLAVKTLQKTIEAFRKTSPCS